MRTLALDIGATKVAIAIIDERHQILERLEVPSNTGEVIWPSLEAAIADFDVDLIGVASAGPIDRENGTISPVNIPQWRAFPIAENLKGLSVEGLAVDNQAAADAGGDDDAQHIRNSHACP